MKTCSQYIEHHHLEPHPEGGFYHRLHASSFLFSMDENRKASSSVHYMLLGNQHSAFHRIDAEEVWYYADGVPMELFLIYPDGSLERKLVGKNTRNNEQLAVYVAPGVWMAAQPSIKIGFAAVICHVTPEFLFEGFQLASRKNLISRYPLHKEIITMFTPQENTQA